MELTINVTPEEFENKIKEGLDGFSKEELTDMCRQGILKCLSDPHTFQQIFIGKTDTYKYNEYYYANDVLKEAMKHVDLSEAFDEFKQKAIEYLNTEYKNIISKMFSDMFVEGLIGTLQTSSEFSRAIQNAIWQYMQSKENN